MDQHRLSVDKGMEGHRHSSSNPAIPRQLGAPHDLARPGTFVLDVQPKPGYTIVQIIMSESLPEMDTGTHQHGHLDTPISLAPSVYSG